MLTPMIDDLKSLTDDQLEQLRADAEKELAEAQRIYLERTGNLSSNPDGKIPSTPLRQLQKLDDAVVAAEQNLDMITNEFRRRGLTK
jgi:hypothetical protein